MAAEYRRGRQADQVFIATTILMPILLGALIEATPITSASAGGRGDSLNAGW